MGHACGEPNEIELTIRVPADYCTALFSRPLPESQEQWRNITQRMQDTHTHGSGSGGGGDGDIDDVGAVWGSPARAINRQSRGPGLADPIGVGAMMRGTHPALSYVSRAGQFHPHGGQFDFVCLPTRTMHPHGVYVW